MAEQAKSEPIGSAGTVRAANLGSEATEASDPAIDQERARIKARLFGDSQPEESGTGAGTVLADRYRLDEPIGQGGMGAVWKGTHLSLKSPIAVKLIDPRLAGTDEARARFVREAQSAASLRGGNVVQILDYGVHDERIPYIVMELLEGQPLSDRLREKGKLTPEEAVPIIVDICRAIGRAHEKGIYHRDLKPDNVFVVKEGDREVCKVLDFGIAKAADSGTLTADGSTPTQTGAILGTPHYMSPEQAENSKDVDHRADLWSLGVITYQMLLGDRPFKGETITQLVLKICTSEIPVPSEHGGDLGPDFDTWFAIACSRDIDGRFDSARDMGEALREAFGMPTDGAATHSRLAAKSPPPAKKAPNKAVLLLAGLVGAGAIGGVALSMSSDEPVADSAPAAAGPSMAAPTEDPVAADPGDGAEGAPAKSGESGEAAEEPGPEAAARELQQTARGKLELMDHKGAADLLEQAYAQLIAADSTPDVLRARQEILLDLVEAKVGAFTATSDVAHLQRANELISKAVADAEAAGEDTAALVERQDELAGQLAAVASKTKRPPRVKTKKPEPKPTPTKTKKPDLEF